MVKLHCQLLIVSVLAALSGCQTTSWSHHAAATDAETREAGADGLASREGSKLITPVPSPAAPVPGLQQAATFTDPNSFSSSLDAVTEASASEADVSSLDANDTVFRELQAIGAADPAAAQVLVEKLKEAKPSLRPLVAQQFRASWEYHRELTGAAGGAVAPGSGAVGSGAQVASLPMSGQSTAAPSPQAAPQPVPKPAPVATPPPEESTEAPPAETTEAPAPEPEDPPAAKREPEQAATSDAGSDASGVKVVQASHTSEATPKLLPVTDEQKEAGDEARDKEEPMREEPLDWQEAISQTVAQLEASTPEEPTTTHEAYQHVRLRLMHLMAGNQDKALEPVPGLTPTEQSYWSNQLFALATLLDYQQQPDDQRRAELASSQLDEAAARLGELSSLGVRNLAFSEKVYGFGDYEKLESTKFAPGETVTLYAEMANFRSESTEDGYHTSLATSYEVLDKSGNLVEGGEFATVDDYCTRKRRDFYIEYTLQLPSRIYANEYQLRLVVRDRLSGKIGKATIDFEITK